MGLIIIILLGIVQGASEFLPISSSGHLVVFYNIFGITENVLLLSVILHVGTLLAVIVVYRKDIATLIKAPFNKINIALLISTMITVFMVLLFKGFIVSSFDGRNIELFFVITAITLLIAQFVSQTKNNNPQKNIYNNSHNQNQNNKNNTNQNNIGNNQNTKTENVMLATTQIHRVQTKTTIKQPSTNNSVLNLNITYFQALFIGFAQGLATVPGISRSGLTISMALLVGVNKDDAPTYSFLMSLPIILASLFYEVIELSGNSYATDFSFLQLFVGFVVSFLVGWLCLRVMINFVKKQKLYFFSIYLAALVLFLTLNTHFLKWF